MINENHLFFFILASIKIDLLKLFFYLIFLLDRSYSALHPTDYGIDCRPDDIQLYTWVGPEFQPGDCWYRGHRFSNGDVWGRKDNPDSAYCLCEQGRVRIFDSQNSAKPTADALTLFAGFPTSKDLEKWPISTYRRWRRRLVLCSPNRLGIRIRSRDNCLTCKCSTHGHWLCRRTRFESNNPNEYEQNQVFLSDSSRSNVQYASNRRLEFCILIERVATSNGSRYIEIPRETSWIDESSCSRCFCSSNGIFHCQQIRSDCSRGCLVEKTRSFSMIYYFPSGSQWFTPSINRCRTCSCHNGQRRCHDCHEILSISIDSKINRNSVSIPSGARPCLLQTENNIHRLIYPGQQTWFQGRCYFCSNENSQLIQC